MTLTDWGFPRRALRYGSAFAFALLLGGCALAGLGSSGPAPNTYDLTAPRDFPGLKAHSGAQILIQEPIALKALDSERIVVRPNSAALEYFAGAQWSDRLPKLLQSRIAQTFENSGKVRAVGRPGEGLLIDYQLITEVREFQIDTGGSDSAVVTISAKILNDRNGRVVAGKVFSAQTAASATSADAAVAALDRALDNVLREMVAWTLSRI